MEKYPPAGLPGCPMFSYNRENADRRTAKGNAVMWTPKPADYILQRLSRMYESKNAEKRHLAPDVLLPEEENAAPEKSSFSGQDISGILEGSAGCDEVLSGLQSYWNERSETYSEQNLEEMNGWQRDVWRDLILENAPAGDTLRILDVGTGPGFFAINLALAGHTTVGVDVTEEMLRHAEKNAQAYGANALFEQYDGMHLPFEDGSFDLVISRNVVWNLEDPEGALREWKRVLKTGGRILYFDANWYLYLFDEEQRKRHEETHLHMKEAGIEYHHASLNAKRTHDLEIIAGKLPLSPVHRPEWDAEAMKRAGMRTIRIEPDINDLIYRGTDRIHYSDTPEFMVCAEKI